MKNILHLLPLLLCAAVTHAATPTSGSFDQGQFKWSAGYLGAEEASTNASASNVTFILADRSPRVLVTTNTSNQTITISQVPALSGRVKRWLVHIKMDGSSTLTWAGTSPTLGDGDTFVNPPAAGWNDYLLEKIGGTLFYHPLMGQVAAVAGSAPTNTVVGTTFPGVARGIPAGDASGTNLTFSANAIISTNNAITIRAASITASEPMINASQTLNNGAVKFQWMHVVVTNTASASTSEFVGLDNNNTNRISLKLDGSTVLSGDGSTAVGFYDKLDADTVSRLGAFIDITTGTPMVGFGAGGASARDLFLARDGAQILSIRNGTSPIVFRLYNTWTDASNGEWASMNWTDTANRLSIGTKMNGTGVSRAIDVIVGGTSTLGLDGLSYKLGTDAAAPGAKLVIAAGPRGGTDSNTAGPNLTIAGSPGTGTGAGGSVIIATSPIGGSGTATNASVARITVAANGETTFSSRSFSGTPTTALGTLFTSASELSLAAANVFALENTTASSSTQGAFLDLGSNDGAALASGDRLGGLSFFGSSSASAVRTAATIQAFTSQAWVDASSYGSRLSLKTTPNNTTTQAEVVGVEQDGRITFGDATGTGVSIISSGTTLKIRLGDGTGDGKLTADIASFTKTITAPGTTGAQTINKASGRVNFAAASQTLVVTDSLVTANSIIMVTLVSDDTTAKSCIATPAAGSFTLKLNAGATAETAVNFIVTN